MRAAPSASFAVGPSRLWRGALVLAASLALAVTLVWAAQRRDALAAAVLLLVSLHVGWVIFGLVRRPVLMLAWNGRTWSLAQAGGEAREGALAVSLDLGGAMLLRFRADAALRGRRVRWLPVERAAQPHAWHALRCAVYSPQPGAPVAHVALGDS